MRLHLRVVVAYGAVAEVLCIDWFNDRMVFSMPPKVLYVSGAMLVPPLPQAERCPHMVPYIKERHHEQCDTLI